MSAGARHVRTLEKGLSVDKPFAVPRVGVEPTLPSGHGVTARSQPTLGFSAW